MINPIKICCLTEDDAQYIYEQIKLNGYTGQNE